MLVTGGSRGIGAATVLLAAKQGWRVAFCWRSHAVAAQELVQCLAGLGHDTLAVQADVSDEMQVQNLFDRVLQATGRIDCLVNNAGMVAACSPFADMSLARWQQTFATNVFGSMLCARVAVHHMSTAHGGRGGNIINVGSVASRLGAGGRYIDYAASKGAIESFTIGLAREVAAEGVRVNLVRPGIIDTEIHASGGLPDRARDMASLIPMQRPGTADEVAHSILYLLSDAASYVTGAALNVSGGR